MIKHGTKNRFYSIRTSNGQVKNFTVFADGKVSVQYMGDKIRTKYLGTIGEER